MKRFTLLLMVLLFVALGATQVVADGLPVIDAHNQSDQHIPYDEILDLMKEAGAVITSTESVIYQILKKAGTKEFKKMLKLMK